ncbi:MAG: CoA-binding protein, partial [Actinophytocola sp.]|nr:CoA-binding protein [Actinophytocola sp.]
LAAAGKPVIVLTVGASEASQAAARSHTGALTSATDVVAAACAAAGAVLVETPAQAVDVAHLLLDSPMPRGRRVAVVSDSGGQGALAADALVRAGLAVPRLSSRTAAALAELLPTADAVSNPLDLAGAGEQDLSTYGRVVEWLLRSDEVDTVVLSGYFGTYGVDTPELADREMDVVDTLADAVRSHARPVVVHSLSHDSPAVRSMRAKSVPALHTIDGVARSLALAVQLSTERRAGGAAGDVLPSEATAGTSVGYLAARDLVASYGVRYPRGRAIDSVADLRAAIVDLEPPYVLKAAWLEHKTELGGVVVSLADPAAAEAALTEMTERLGRGTYVVEEMDTGSDVVELIVGARRDPCFGPVVMVGLGGVHAELYRDTRLALAPVTEADALRMIQSLRAYPLLRGWRGRPAVDVDAAAAVVAGVSRLLAEQPGVAECEVNPLRVGPTGALAVDALVLAADAAAKGR